jgi:RNA polymerase sigma factor (sigma-70 family)
VPHTKYTHIATEDLLTKYYDSKDPLWIGIALERHTYLLLGLCMKYLKNEEEAKDAVQQVFLKAIVELEKYKVNYLKSWLYMICKNHCLVLLRQQNKTIDASNLEQLPFYEPDKIEAQEKEKLALVLENVLPLLNEAQRKCIELFYLEKNSYQNVAALTGLTMLEVKSHIQNGKRNLKLLIEKNLKNE